MKKFFSLMLVALLLVSALPFAAFADESATIVSQGSALCGHTVPHTWTRNAEGDLPAGCTTAGYEDYVCYVNGCGTHGRKTIPAKNHAYPAEWTITLQATCEGTGSKVKVCANGCGVNQTETIPSLGGHAWVDDTASSANAAATCEGTGTKAQKCNRTGCTATQNVTLDALDHAWVKDTAATTHVAATCTVAGSEAQKCSRTGCTATRTIEVAALNHNYVNGVCQRTGCGNIGTHIAAITFHFLNADGQATSEIRYVTADGQTITPPSVPTNNVAGFTRWAENANGTGVWINRGESVVYSSTTPTAFHAIYEEPREKSEMKIYAVRYVNGTRKEAHYLYSKWFDTSSTSNNMYQYLTNNANEIYTAAVNVPALSTGYTWNPISFYDYFTDEKLTTSNMKDNGDKSVYIKLNTKDSNEAKVLLYVHKNDTSKTLLEVLPMDGYNAGEKVYLNNNVRNFLKNNGYSWSTINMYSSAQWESLKNGNSPSGTNVVDIDENATYVIHVVLGGASSSSKADTTNPKTGDYIMIAVTTMVLAAAAVITLAELKKRKMI